MKHFEITGSYQKPEHRYRQNIRVYVVTETAQRAMHLVLDKYPDVDIWSINHKGSVDVIIDETA